MSDITLIQNFTTPIVPPRKFQVDDDIFECVGELPAGASTYMADMAKADDLSRIAMLGGLLDMIIMPTSATRFAERLRDPVQPITASTLGKIIKWLMEVYSGGFPTPQPSDSVNGLVPTGMNSMAGVQPVV